MEICKRWNSKNKKNVFVWKYGNIYKVKFYYVI
jgi:hypothetical protein